MPTLVLKTHLYEPESGETLTPGTEVEATDKRAEELIKRGTAVLKSDAEVATDVDNKVREGETVAEFELNDYKYRHLRDSEGDFYTVNDQEADENAFINALQEKTRVELEKEHAQEAEAEADNAPLVQQESQGVQKGQPTPEEIAAALASTEASSTQQATEQNS